MEIRLARPDELHKISLVALRSFVNDPVQAYFAGGRGFTSRPPAETARVRDLDQKQRLHYYFLDGLARGTLLTGGRIVVIAVGDRIAAAAYWMPPGAEIDSPGVVLKSKQHRVMFGDRRCLFRGWGIRGLIRAVWNYQVPVDDIQREQCLKRGTDMHDCWHLQLIFTDPDFEGQGCCGKLMREFFAFAPDAPILLEGSTPRSRDLYLHYGFELTGEVIMGKGVVAPNGLIGQDASLRNGVPTYPMLRLPAVLKKEVKQESEAH